MSVLERIEALARAARLRADSLRSEADVARAAWVSGAEAAREGRLRAAAIARAEARADNAARKRLGLAERPFTPKAEHADESFLEKMDLARRTKVERLDAEAASWAAIAASASRGRLPLCSELPNYGPAPQAEIEQLSPGLLADAGRAGLVERAAEGPPPYYFIGE